MWFEFLFFTGLLISEALTLHWDSVDKCKRQVHICHALGKIAEL